MPSVQPKGSLPLGQTGGLYCLKAMRPEKLLQGNNCLYLYRNLPDSWARGRTTLIPKVARPEGPGDFRPITIPSLLVRVFNKILARRLMNVAPLPSAQKGFAPEEGVAANIYLLQTLIEDSRTHYENFCVAFIDFKKAFDSIGHPSLIAATQEVGTPWKSDRVHCKPV